MTFRKMAAPLAGLGVCLALLLAGTGSRTSAQGTISVSFANFGTNRWPAGPDFATDVLLDPWDFCNTEDLSQNPAESAGWTNLIVNTTSPCTAGGTTTTVGGNNDSSLTMLHRGFHAINNPGRNGLNFPIDSSKYQKLGYRMSNTAGDRGRLVWNHYAYGDPAGTGGGVRFGDVSTAGYRIYSYDMTENLAAGIPWENGDVRELRLTPNTGQVGQNVFYDWVRLTYRDNEPGAAMQRITWTGGSGTATIQVSDGNGTPLTVASDVNSPYDWNYGVLPPGNYTLTVTRGSTTSSPRSFTINAPPVVTLTEPNETGGEDFATTVLGNAWDMDSPNDIRTAGSSNWINPNFNGGIFTATNFDTTGSPNASGDPTVTVFNQENNSVPINTSRYRYLTYRMAIDDPNNTREWGIARAFWTSQQFLDGNTATSTTDIIVWPSIGGGSPYHTYTLDLSTLTVANGGLVDFGPRELWAAAAKTGFRFDPSEYPDPRPFHIDYIKLAAMHETVNGSFTFRWTSTGSSGASMALYLDTDKNPGNGKGTQIVSGLAMNTGQYIWPSSGFTPGEYWVYAEATDGIDTQGSYSSGQLRVLAGTSAAPDPAMAIDTPPNGSTQAQPFNLSGWAVDRGATSGTGVDAVHVYATSSSGASSFVGAATLGIQRNDIAGLFGARFGPSGFSLTVSTLPPDTYTFTAYAHSTVTGSFNQWATRTITIPTPQPIMWIDSPADNATVGSPFTLIGWAADRAALSGTGVDAVHIYRSPAGGGSLTFVGAATYGSSRPDVGAAIGSQFTNSGFSFSASLPPGSYRLTAYAHSTVTGNFNNNLSITVTVAGPVSNPAIWIDSPVNGGNATRPFVVGGWAIDQGAPSGTGVSAVHVYAFPVNGGSFIFLGPAAYGSSRPDIGAAFGTRFTNSGYNLTVTAGMLPAGQYDITAYAASTVTNSFNNSRTVRVTVN